MVLIFARMKSLLLEIRSQVADKVEMAREPPGNSIELAGLSSEPSPGSREEPPAAPAKGMERRMKRLS